MPKKTYDPKDLIACPLCEDMIRKNGSLADGKTEPYKGMSLITHFKQVHGTNSEGIDKILGLVPGTTPKCSPALNNKFKSAGAKGAVALQLKNSQNPKMKKKTAVELEDAALDDIATKV